jgi:3-phenylpropionate/trans-cinnamate dioxygenase ferredoxin reductase subunit
LESADRVLARVTAPAVSTFYERVHRAAGVQLRTGAQVESFALDAIGQRVTGVVCSGGERLDCDLVVAGIGLLPNTELAAACGLLVDDGIVVDAGACTSDPHIVAAGDCTRFHSALYGRPIRLESVPNALAQARCAAATLVGKRPPPEGVPWFWSDQYDLKLKMVGLSQGHEQLVLRGSPEDGAFCAFYLQGRRVLAVDTVNRIPDFMIAKRLVAERIEVDPQQLADPTQPLKSLLPI